MPNPDTGFNTYNPHLHERMAVCDANFIRLLKLLPALKGAAGKTSLSGLDPACLRRTVMIPGNSGLAGMQVSLFVKEHFRYTTEIEVMQQRPHSEGHYRTPSMLIRLYHDAKTAEVISYQQQRTSWQLSNKGCSSGWHGLSIEKSKLNTFLGEWLGLCLTRGVAPPGLLIPQTGDAAGG